MPIDSSSFSGTVPNSRAVVSSAERRATCPGSVQKGEEGGVGTASSVVKKVTCLVSVPKLALQGEGVVEQEEVVNLDFLETVFCLNISFFA